ncbi:MAG: four helix bundle protein [Ignavibacteria bacterium GWA2_35_9]|nr:MAG: four helix bundle protein [Ignavibacteria bacterium GWA2_35_9]OGU46624.1 MAG: four helix bundle protein [Ignavibacteria bacterium GWB2_36_8]
MKNDNIIQKKSFDFALKIIELYKELVIQKEFILSKQLLRSGTSIGANVEEALAGQSKKDFIAKMSLASKEARETKYCLKLLQESQIVKRNFAIYIKSIDEIISILTAIVKTSQIRFLNNSTLKI